ncbi:ATP-binding protein, partial [Streptomyces sp. NPDC048209]|uniref:ATP-binding protein n=1 Tax=Streptomyces sp. NPDC048209 TaxID=3156689 RepID=UPI0034423870
TRGLPRPGGAVTTVAERPASVQPSAPATAMLPYTPEAAGAARRLVHDKLGEWGLPHLIDDAELIVSELVANAAKTGCQRRMTVAIRRPAEQTVRISVRDGSRVLPCLLLVGDDAPGGRGLAIVHALTGGRWGASPEGLGKTVHADLNVSRPG